MKEIIEVPERGSGPAVWIISTQQWPRAFIRAELIERGFNARGFEEAGQAVAALGERIRPLVIIVDLRQLSPTRIHLQNLAHKQIPMVALGGEMELEQPLVKEVHWTAVLKLPFTIRDVCAVVEKLVIQKP